MFAMHYGVSDVMSLDAVLARVEAYAITLLFLNLGLSFPYSYRVPAIAATCERPLGRRCADTRERSERAPP